ncbi:MAG: GNAT family N-acetyltransferase [Planctomycetota bacterium]|jgi:N-acetylglutamate synthase-like GNAT family acetyltransferase
MPDITYRHVEHHDLAQLAVFIEPFVADGKLLPRTTVELQELVRNGFLAELDGEIVGFAALEIYSSKLSEIRSLAVSTSIQRSGIGRELVRMCVERAHELNILEVMAVTSSEDFFKNCGFDFTLPGEKKALFIRTRD